MNPASNIIEICGGAKNVADMTERHLSNVGRWSLPRERGGTNGKIPSDVQSKLLVAAVRQGYPLRPEHFFEIPDDVRQVLARQEAAA